MTELKTTNPKDIISSNKVPLHLWPESATIHGCLALLDGMLKYGRSNWREDGIRVTVYTDACKRHILRYVNGQTNDPDSGLHNLAHAIACLAIILDAEACDNVVDDRNYNGEGVVRLLDSVSGAIDGIREKHKDKSPKHYTIQDNEVW